MGKDDLERERRYRWPKEEVKHDAIGLTELRGQGRQWEGPGFIMSEDPGPEDPAAGVALMLSPGYEQRVMCSGRVGARIVWARIVGVFCNEFVVCVYLPHREAVRPTQFEVMVELQQLLETVPGSGDCVVVMGDLNLRLARNVEGYTGRYHNYQSQL